MKILLQNQVYCFNTHQNYSFFQSLKTHPFHGVLNIYRLPIAFQCYLTSVLISTAHLVLEYHY